MYIVLKSKFNSVRCVLSTNILCKRDLSVEMKAKKMSVSDEDLKQYFPDLPSGPLDKYRKQATFDWRRMKLSYENLNTIKLKVSISK